LHDESAANKRRRLLPESLQIVTTSTVALQYFPQPISSTAFSVDDFAWSDSDPEIVLEQKEGDFVGVIDRVGLTVDGLEVGSGVGNTVGALFGVNVCLVP